MNDFVQTVHKGTGKQPSKMGKNCNDGPGLDEREGFHSAFWTGFFNNSSKSTLVYRALANKAKANPHLHGLRIHDKGVHKGQCHRAAQCPYAA